MYIVGFNASGNGCSKRMKGKKRVREKGTTGDMSKEITNLIYY